MNINPINNNQKNNVSFEKLKKIKCNYNGCNNAENRVKLELQNMAMEHEFFKNNNVNAFINIKRNIAELTLQYKPAAKTLMDNFKSLFADTNELVIANYHNCPDEGMYLIVKGLREAKNSEDLFKLAKKN